MAEMVEVEVISDWGLWQFELLEILFKKTFDSFETSLGTFFSLFIQLTRLSLKLIYFSVSLYQCSGYGSLGYCEPVPGISRWPCQCIMVALIVEAVIVFIL